MSDMFGVAATAAVALSANVTKTVVQITAPANHRVKVLGWGVFFDGVSSTAQPVRIRLYRQTTAGTMTLLSLQKIAPRTESLLTTAQHTATVEPSLGDLLEQATCHPQQGYEVKFPQGFEIVLGGGERLGIELLAVAAVNATSKIFFEE